MVFTIFNIVETLLINLIHTHLIAEKKYSTKIIGMVLATFTIVLAVIVYIVGIQSETTVKSVVVGGFYIIPLYFLYKTDVKKILTIIIYCWTYTMLLNTLAFGISHLLKLDNIIQYTFIIQSILLIASIFFVLQFSRNQFVVILDNASLKTRNYLLILGLSVFATIISIRFYLSPHETIFTVLILTTVTIGITSYILLYVNVQSNIKLDSANQIAFNDSLTGINNRYSLFKDLNRLTNKKQHFHVLFLDLDDLKSVNDTYSHGVGDDYLREFAKSLNRNLGITGTAYRFAGDEFICIISKNVEFFDIKVFESNISNDMNTSFKFKGVSIGISRYPEDALTPDDLINQADSNMYGVKRSRQIRGIRDLK